MLTFSALILSVLVLREYERGVIFTLGRFSHVGGPELLFLVPLFQQMNGVKAPGA